MGNVLFVVWRESFEALLVIGIIYSWIKRHPDTKNGMKFLWGGVALGVLLSVLLALAIYGVFSNLEDFYQALFMIFMEVLACILIVQMVYWMNKHGKEMSRALINNIDQQAKQHSWWGALFIIAIAIAREGSEIVVFLSAIIMNLTPETTGSFAAEVAIGLGVAAITLALFIWTSKIVSWKWFFTITGIMLLFLAVTLLLRASDEVANLFLEYDIDLPSFFETTLWDTSHLLDDGQGIGNFLSSFFAYRSAPTGLSITVFAIYWIIVIALFWRGRRAHAAH
ncbi:FTR1 family protein [Wohlfahrtiimonas chitiniclastica]|uniref:FTR1 family iron permease n=1 Tax=Wohlfahrtiimonas chitiniclastica TaxID=400946 RepID=UPI001BD125E6|nr:FTR1 family protein [Wohlfahrtiimonas chitiniclastica]MBS7833714.1 FTR1 family protein [Wohlfahrtiimonas chitiniclastica]